MQTTSQEITRKSSSNLALSFILLPREKREAMTRLYAFCRVVDDIADEESSPVSERQKELQSWREGLQKIFKDQDPGIPVLREFAPIIQQYQIPYEPMEQLILGMEMDLQGYQYATWEDLDLYCYRAASVVGLMCIRVFGYRDPATEQYAVAMGRALQYTNILRDVKKDCEHGRIYLPCDELGKFGVTLQDIRDFRYTPSWQKFAVVYKERTLGYYRQALETLSPTDRPHMIASELMGAVYWQLLLKLIRSNYNVFDHEGVRLSKWEKIVRILLTWAKFKLGFKSPSYGVLKK